jgi:hypothetical protein
MASTSPHPSSYLKDESYQKEILGKIVGETGFSEPDGKRGALL